MFQRERDHDGRRQMKTLHFLQRRIRQPIPNLGHEPMGLSPKVIAKPFTPTLRSLQCCGHL